MPGQHTRRRCKVTFHSSIFQANVADVKSHSVIVGLALALLQCTGNKSPVWHPVAPAQTIVELPASSVQSLGTMKLGERIGFAVKICPDKKALSVPIGSLTPAIRQIDESPVPRLATFVPFDCTLFDPDQLGPQRLAECVASSRDCTTVAGLVNHSGPTTLEFIGPSKDPHVPSAIKARVTLNLPEPQPNQPAESYDGLMKTLADAEMARVPGTFSTFWTARRAVVFPGPPSIDELNPGRAALKDPLWDPWLSASHVVEKAQMAVVGGLLDPDERTTVPVDVVLPPKLAQRATVPAASPIEIPDMARFVPKDAAWVRFASVSKLNEALDRIEDLASGALLGLQQEAKDRMLRARYSGVLGVDLPSLTRLFEDGLANELGLVTHDLSVRDGTDVTLLVHVAANDAARERLRQMVADVGARARAKASRLSSHNRTIASLHSDDGTVNSYLMFEGSWALISNSVVALQRLLETHDGKRASLSSEADYRFLLGAGSKSADGTLHLGGAFWDAQQTAERRVAHRRRLICAGAMQVLSSAVLGYRRDRGRTPNMADLISARYVLEDDLRCPDGGNISLQHDSAYCSVHGTLASLNPVIEHLPKMIKPSERDGYREYVGLRKPENGRSREREERIEAQFMLPLEVDFTVGKEFVAKFKVLPNADSEAFTRLRDWLGKNAVDLGAKLSLPDTIASVALDVDPDIVKKIQKSLDRSTRNDNSDFGESGRLAPRRWLGGQVQLFIGDGAPPMSISADSLGLSGLLGLGPFGWLGVQFGSSLLSAAVVAPVSGVVGLKDAELGQEAIRRLLADVDDTRGLLSYVEKYDLLPYRDIVVHTLSVGSFNFHLYYTFFGKNLVFANRKQTMLALVDQLLDHRERTPSALHGQVAIEVFPKAFNVSLDGLESAWQERLRRVCHQHLASYELLAQAFGPRLANDAALSRAYFGFDAKCPEGGRFLFDPTHGGAYCSVHGRPRLARQPTHLGENAAGSKALRPMNHLAWTLATTEHTLESELRIERQ
jgi:hypothetical protein